MIAFSIAALFLSALIVFTVAWLLDQEEDERAYVRITLDADDLDWNWPEQVEPPEPYELERLP